MIRIYPTKIIILIIVQENHFQITLIILHKIHSIIRILRTITIPKIHKISHKTDIVDHIVEINSIKITTQDQIQTNQNFRLILDPIQILDIKIIHLSVLETLHTINIKTIPMIGIKTIQTIETLHIKIIDHAKYKNYQTRSRDISQNRN